MMSHATKIKAACAALLCVLLVLAGLFWYFRVYTKTPEYALRAIERAFETHDEMLFLRYVRLDDVLDTGYDDFMAGTMDTEFGGAHDTSAALADFSKMLKPAFIKMLNDAVHTYLTEGDWPPADAAKDGSDAENILSRIGLRDLSFRETTNLTVDQAAHTAVVDVVAHQDEADADFTFQVCLAPSDDGDWQVVSIRNLYDYAAFLGNARRLRVQQYLEETDAIIRRHDQSVSAAQMRLYRVLGAGALGNQTTRDMARQIMEQDVLADWQERREELSAVSVPRTMQSLQQLRLKICDLHIAYAEGYAAWMTDKNAATIRSAETNLRQADVLEGEATFLAQRARRLFSDAEE